MNTPRRLASSLADLRCALRRRRAARTAHLALERELSAYRSPGELDDWDAMLSRYGDDETAEIRQILNRQRAA